MNNTAKQIIKTAAFVVIGLTFTNCFGINFSSPKNNPKKEFSVKQGFNAIETTGTADIIYTEGEEIKLKISAPKEAFDVITVKVENGVLKIGHDDKKMRNRSSMVNKYSITAYITAPAIKRFATYGTGDIIAERLSGDTIQLQTYGTGDIEISNIEFTFAEMSSYGTGDIEVRNATGKFVKAETQGTGDIEIDKIEVKMLDAITTGTGDISIHSGKIEEGDLSASGTGDIEANGVSINKYKCSGRKGKINVN